MAACAEETGRPATSAPAVGFRTADGLTLSGHLFGSGDRWVILSHMFPDDQSDWYPFAGELGAKGYHVLTYDFRGYGVSQGQKQIDRIDRDLRAAIGYVRGRTPSRVLLLGASMGGTASIVVAADTPVDGLVALSAPETFRGLDALAVASSVRVPSLLIAAQDDDGAAASARDLGTRLATSDKRVEIVNESLHGIHLLERGPAKDQVRAAVLDFLARHAA